MKQLFWMTAAIALMAGNISGQERPAPNEEEGEYVRIDSIRELLEARVVPDKGSGVDPAEGEGKITPFQKASTFVGMEVRNGENETVGKVVDLVFDPEEGKIGYVLLAVENGEGARNVAVPLRAVKPAREGRHLSLNMSEPLLAAAPGVSEGDLPPMDAFKVGESAEAVGGASGAERGSESSGLSLPKGKTGPGFEGGKTPGDGE